MNTDELIPMDDAIAEFRLHLDSHPRTILSAKFGDGKSCFLDAAQKALRKDYEFITIYPVNYQIEENRDVYDLIKYDILFQLYSHKIASPESPLTDDIAFPLFLQFYQKDITAEIFNILSSLRLSGKAGSVVGAVTNLTKGLHVLKERYAEIKESDRYLDTFMSQVEKNSHYESDPISGYLTSAINEWHKKHRKKKLVLLIEDMDRMDPAHMFRILNIISAHIDDCYRYGVRPGDSFGHNKFGFDNIVISLDYSNLQNIFHHFYGEGASFSGYISKFSDRGHFSYSLEEQKAQFFRKKIAHICDIDIKLVEDAFSDDIITSKSLRDLSSALERIDQQIRNVFEEGDWPVHLGLFRLIVILRRLHEPDNKIKAAIESMKTNHPTKLIEYSYCLFSRHKSDSPFFLPYFVLNKEETDKYDYGYPIEKEPNEKGIASVRDYCYIGGSRRGLIPNDDFVETLLSYVGK